MTAPSKSSVGLHEAKTNLSRLLRRVEAGEEITLLRRGKPIARLVPSVNTGLQQRPLGLMRKQWALPPADELVGSDPDLVALFEESIRHD